VTQLDEWWHRKYVEGDDHRLRRVENIHYLASPEGPAEPPHMPSPSYWPLVCALGLPFIAWGLLYSYWLCGVGGLLLLTAIYGWSLEPSVDPAAGHHAVGEHHGDDEPDPEPVAVGAGSGAPDAPETTETETAE
jgi:cytochrome c oxidase subunit 1